MITYVKGNLFESPTKVLVNTVNTVGVMGRGIAKTFKEIYPEMFSQYQQLCERKQFNIGNLWLYKTSHKWILNFPTKKHWRQPSKAEYIDQGLRKFVSIYSALGVTSIAFPQLGCGNGELDWKSVVQPLMTKYLDKLPIDIFVYLYDSDAFPPEHKDIEAMHLWLRSEPRSLAFEEMWNDLRQLIGSGLSLAALENPTNFAITVTSKPEEGLKIHVRSKTIWEFLKNLLSKFVPYNGKPRIIAPGEIFVPQQAMLDLWQSIRTYGFCVARVMPDGLDVLAPYVMALMARLDYMKTVKLSTSRQTSDVSEIALQLFLPPDNRAAGLFQQTHMVQPV